MHTSIKHYQLQHQLGSGGTANVYLAIDEILKREVAIKLIRADLAEHEQYRRYFEREAQIIASLEHLAVVPIYEYGEIDGQIYLVMRLMRGGSLADRLAQGTGKLSLAEVIALLERLAPTLDEIHSRGIVHRDLKPGNILYDEHENAYIADFGIALLQQSTTRLTEEGQSLGTPQYCSPEQIAAQRELDPRSDIYTLGAMLYKILSGDYPFWADTPLGWIYQHLQAPIPNILEHSRDLPKGVKPVIEGMLAKSSADRYESVGAVLADLKRAAAGDPVLGAKGKGIEVIKATPTRRFHWAWLLVPILLAVGVGGFLLRPSSESGQPPVDIDIPNIPDIPILSPPDDLSVASAIQASDSVCGLSPYEPFPRIEATPDEALNALFTRTEGWTGGAQLRSVVLPDGRTLWLSTNPYFGGRNPDGTRNPDATQYSRNTFLVQEGQEFSTFPQEPVDSVPGEDTVIWYTLGEGIQQGEQVVVLAGQQQRTGTGLFDVERAGTSLVTLSLPSLTVESVAPVEPAPLPAYNYGDALLDDEGYLYIYGTHHVEGFTFRTHVARVEGDDLSGAWEYYTGEGWDTDPTRSAPIFEGRISDIVRQGDRYYLLNFANNALNVYQSCSPVGPWENPAMLYRIPDRFPADGKNNLGITAASFHTPTDGDADEWLISYQVGFFFGEPEEVNSVADVSRPRFVRVRLTPGTLPTEISAPSTELQPLAEAPNCTLLPSDTAVTAAPDEALTALFDRNDAGWTAADGAYSVRLPDGRIAWTFGDTYLGGLNPDGSTANLFFSVRNAMAVQNGDTLETRVGGTSEDPQDTVSPPDGFPSGIAWYWPGAGVVEADQVHWVMGRFRRGTTDPFGFANMGSAIATFSLPELQLQQTIPVAEGTIVQYGNALLETDEYTYIYGLQERAGDLPLVHVARAREGSFLGQWDYFAGDGWSANPLDSRSIFEGPTSSVIPYGDRYWLIHHTYPFGSRVIAYQSCTPWGPWENPIDLYTTPESDAGLYTYISIIHPELSEDNSLLLTYSVNGSGTSNVASNYRPRFIRLTIEEP